MVYRQVSTTLVVRGEGVKKMDPAFGNRRAIFQQRNIFNLNPDSGYTSQLYLGVDNPLFSKATRGQRWFTSDPSLALVLYIINNNG